VPVRIERRLAVRDGHFRTSFDVPRGASRCTVILRDRSSTWILPPIELCVRFGLHGDDVGCPDPGRSRVDERGESFTCRAWITSLETSIKYFGTPRVRVERIELTVVGRRIDAVDAAMV